MRGNESVEKVGMFSVSLLHAHEKSLSTAAINGRTKAMAMSLVVPAIVAAVVAVIMMAAPALAADNYAWVSKGPVGTDARQLYCSPSQTGVVYAGTNGGIYKTIDYGDSWFYSGIRFRAIDALRGSGGCNAGLFAGASGDIFNSTNNGGTWDNWGPVGGDITTVLVTNPTNPFYCQGYVGTDNGVIGPNGLRLTGTEIKALAVDSNNYVYAGTGGNGIYKTTDNGLTWNPKNNGLTETQIFSLTIDSSDRIFAGTLGGGVFLSITGGDDWTPKNTDLPILDGNPGFYVAFSLAKDTDGHLYAGMLTDVPPAGAVYMSDDNGDSWTKTGDAIDGFFPESMCVTPNNKLFVGTNMGVFRTDDAGSTWVDQTNKISAIPFSNTFAAYGGTIFIGTEGEGVYKSSDAGETWVQVGTGGPQCIGALLADGSGNLYASTCDISGVYKSVNGGADWTLSSDGLPPDFLSVVEGTSLALEDGGDIYIGLDNGEVYKTSNGAADWVATGSLPANTERVNALAGIGSDTVLAGTDGNGIYKTINGGDDWVQVNTGLPVNANVIDNSFFFDGNTGYIFVGLWEGGLYRSTDSGESWEQRLDPGVSGCDVRSVIRGDTTGNLYAVVCSGAVFQSTDNGATWTGFLNNGLKPGDNVSGINVKGIFTHNGFFAATESSGMYKFSKDLAIIEGAPDVYYASLQDAYNAAVSGDSILALAVNFYSENLFFNNPDISSVILRGGYEAGFATNPEMTSVKGNGTGALTVSQGTVLLQNMIVGFLTISEQGTVYAENVIIL